MQPIMAIHQITLAQRHLKIQMWKEPNVKTWAEPQVS